MAPNKRPEMQRPLPIPQQTPTKRPIVLVVEDDEAISALLVEFLEKEGFRACTATDGWQAVVQAEGMKLELVISDLAMPGPEGTGVHAYMKLRKSPFVAADLPIIFITALPKQQVEAALKLDARCRLFYKPLTLPVLRAAIKELTGR